MKVGMISLGCPKNQVSAEQMLYLLREAGHEITTDMDEAEAVVVNTCAFIEDAKQEAINTVLECRRVQEDRRAQAPRRRRLPLPALRRGRYSRRCPRPTPSWASAPARR